jgi:hypothetical protein
VNLSQAVDGLDKTQAILSHYKIKQLLLTAFGLGHVFFPLLLDLS